MSDEAWLIGRDMDASKKIHVAMKISVFDLELFIGVLCQLAKDYFKKPASNMLSVGMTT